MSFLLAFGVISVPLWLGHPHFEVEVLGVDRQRSLQRATGFVELLHTRLHREAIEHRLRVVSQLLGSLLANPGVTVLAVFDFWGLRFSVLTADHGRVLGLARRATS